MKLKSIQSKILLALVICVVVGVGCIVGLMYYFTVENAAGIALDAVTGSQKLFTIMESREISKMTAVSDVLVMNTQVREAFADKDRSRLLQLTMPLYPQLKSEGITNWMFQTPEPNMSVFLRLHNTSKFGDRLNRFMDTKVVRTHDIVAGNELARAGFAVRIIRPVYDTRGGISGYLEFGEELGQFVHALKNQTGNDYGLLLDKKFVDRQFWADSSAMWKRRDNWNDNSGYVVADKTTVNDNILQFQGSLSAIPDQGKILEQYSEGQSQFVRGIFPIHDVAGNTVGAMFVVRDITDSYLKMRRTQNILLVMTVACFLLGVILLLTLLDRLIFRRLVHVIRAATRLVGGDFKTAIKIDSDDEVGQLEQLFEQFRHIFVELMKQMTATQER